MFNELRSSWRTTEFWFGLVAAGICVAFPDFPKEAFMGLGMWIAARTVEKGIGGDPVRRAWQTKEFWIAIAVGLVQYVYPAFDPTVLYTALSFIGLRPIAKGFVKRSNS